MIAQIFRFFLRQTYITRKHPRPFNEIHKSSCIHGQNILHKRYLSTKQAIKLIFEDDGKYHYDGCRFCMPEMNTEELHKKNIK